ncbi:MAG: prepilin-type N-terminal cleavage/methylation domain-containing protein [Magnetococcales bacterium]|nr:prepilin-type N-terminal cleavage/methylation domain-containing protein [Magnetococcales bacterium]
MCQSTPTFFPMLSGRGRGGQRGYTLMELLVAITIGFILFAWITDYMTRALGDHTTTLQRSLLNQEIKTTLAMVEREVRRSGSWAGAATAVHNGFINPFTQSPNGLQVGNLTGRRPTPALFSAMILMQMVCWIRLLLMNVMVFV